MTNLKNLSVKALKVYAAYVLLVIVLGFCFGIWQGLHISGWL